MLRVHFVRAWPTGFQAHPTPVHLVPVCFHTCLVGPALSTCQSRLPAPRTCSCCRLPDAHHPCAAGCGRARGAGHGEVPACVKHAGGSGAAAGEPRLRGDARLVVRGRAISRALSHVGFARKEQLPQQLSIRARQAWGREVAGHVHAGSHVGGTLRGWWVLAACGSRALLLRWSSRERQWREDAEQVSGRWQQCWSCISYFSSLQFHNAGPLLLGFRLDGEGRLEQRLPDICIDPQCNTGGALPNWQVVSSAQDIKYAGLHFLKHFQGQRHPPNQFKVGKAA